MPSSLLLACGGGESSPPAPTDPVDPEIKPPSVISQQPASKVLLVQAGGLSYPALMQAMASLTGAGASAPADLQVLYARPSQADVQPTVLRHLGVDAWAGREDLEGQALQAPGSIHSMQASSGKDKASVLRSWKLGQEPSAPLKLLRDAEPIATLPAGTTQYTDDRLPAI